MAETLHEMAVRITKGEDGKPRCGKGCGKCPAAKLRDKNGGCLIRRAVQMDNCEEQIEGLKAWAAEHPAPRYPTWREWYDAEFMDEGFFHRLCPAVFGDEYWCCGAGACDKCRDRPISADIAAKLGIRPINAECSNCKYTDKAEDEVPCVMCRRTQVVDSAKWDEMPDLWEEG